MSSFILRGQSVERSDANFFTWEVCEVIGHLSHICQKVRQRSPMKWMLVWSFPLTTPTPAVLCNNLFLNSEAEVEKVGSGLVLVLSHLNLLIHMLFILGKMCEYVYACVCVFALVTVTKGLLKRLEDLKIRGRGETIQTTILLRTARLLRRVLET